MKNGVAEEDEGVAFENLSIKMTGALTRGDAERVRDLEAACLRADNTHLKLELDYKLGAGAQGGELLFDELMAFDADRLVGYLGVGCFGEGSTPELMGMVRPDFRGRGVFTALHHLALTELRRRGFRRALLLADRISVSGQRFIEKTGAAYHHSEYEMYLRNAPSARAAPEISLRKAVNADAPEIARQNVLYFGEERGDGDADAKMPLPEEEEKRGMTIYLAESLGETVGKVHLQLIDGLGGIYGLGVLPEKRGRGLGRAILTEGVLRLKAAGARDVMLQVATGNENALGLYRSCGFETTSTMDYFELKL